MRKTNRAGTCRAACTIDDLIDGRLGGTIDDLIDGCRHITYTQGCTWQLIAAAVQPSFAAKSKGLNTYRIILSVHKYTQSGQQSSHT